MGSLRSSPMIFISYNPSGLMILVHGAKFENQVIGLLKTSVIITHEYLLKWRQVIIFWIATMLSVSLEKGRKAWVQYGSEHVNLLINFVKVFWLVDDNLLRPILTMKILKITYSSVKNRTKEPWLMWFSYYKFAS